MFQLVQKVTSLQRIVKVPAEMRFIQIYLLGCIILLACPLGSLAENSDSDTPVPPLAIPFETSHKSHHPQDEFQTSHNNLKLKYLVDQSKDDDHPFSLMQLQQGQNIISTKERPELNPVLSALINEDVMKNIEAKRATEHKLSDSKIHPTSESPIIITTSNPGPITKAGLLENEGNVGLVDQSINLEAAGSENNPKSRIEIKNGPNGMDYEYEYVYYYYDDDDNPKSGKKSQEGEPAVVEEKTKKGSHARERGKSHYTNIERNSKSASQKEEKAQGSANAVPIDEEADSERLPSITRFPARVKSIDSLPVASTKDIENTVGLPSEESKKIAVKHPSLELVDSETFNTDEKQAKGSPRHSNPESPAPTSTTELVKSTEAEDKDEPKEAETSTSLSLATIATPLSETTPLAEKAALDLYAILANQNLEDDAVTDASSISTEGNIEATTEAIDGAETKASTESTSTTITTSTTTLAPTTEATTTTTAATITSTTVVTTPASDSLFGANRRGTTAGGKYRFRSKAGTTPSTTTAVTEPSASAKSSGTKQASGFKGKGFQRPSLGGRKRPTSTTETSATGEEEAPVVKEKEKSVSSGSGFRGKTRNRFNLHGQTTSTTTEAPKDGAEPDEENQVSSTTARSFARRPLLKARGKTRVDSRKNTPAPTHKNEVISPAADNNESAEEKPSVAPLPTRSSRFNLNRIGGNRPLPPSRLNGLRTSTAPPEVTEVHESNNSANKEEPEESETAQPDAETTIAPPAGGNLNRPKLRPRQPIPNKTDNKAKVAPIAPRKINPLLQRRKLTIRPTKATQVEPTSEAPEESEDNVTSSSSSTTESTQIDADKAPVEETTEVSETVLKEARGLGLLSQRRRLPLRRPSALLKPNKDS